jgi:hypothetical protein
MDFKIAPGVRSAKVRAFVSAVKTKELCQSALPAFLSKNRPLEEGGKEADRPGRGKHPSNQTLNCDPSQKGAGEILTLLIF